MVLEKQNRISLSLLILLCILNHKICAQSAPSENKNVNINNKTLVGLGVILNMESWTGKSIHWCITMAISDFYALHHNYRTRLLLHTRDSKGDPIEALSAGTSPACLLPWTLIFNSLNSIKLFFLSLLLFTCLSSRQPTEKRECPSHHRPRNASSIKVIGFVRW